MSSIISGSGAQVPFLFLFALISLPIIEIASILQVSSLIGPLPTFLLLVAFSCLGLYLIRMQSVRLGDRIMQAMRQGSPPQKPVLDGAMVSFAGVLFTIPGFLTDILAVILLLPFARRQIWSAISSGMRARTGTNPQGGNAGAASQKHQPSWKKDDDVIDVDFTEVKPANGERSGSSKVDPGSPWRKPE